jgi:hypothetical protein
VFSALVERCVDVGGATRDAGGDGVAHGRDVPAGDRLDRAVGQQPVNVRGHLHGPSAAVDHHESQLPGQNAAIGVHFLGGELGAQFTGRSEHTCGALQRDDERDVERLI